MFIFSHIYIRKYTPHLSIHIYTHIYIYIYIHIYIYTCVLKRKKTPTDESRICEFSTYTGVIFLYRSCGDLTRSQSANCDKSQKYGCGRVGRYFFKISYEKNGRESGRLKVDSASIHKNPDTVFIFDLRLFNDK